METLTVWKTQFFDLKKKTPTAIYHIGCMLLLNLGMYANAKAQTALPTDNIIVTNNAAVINNLTIIGPAEATTSSFMGKQDNLTKKAELELKKQAVAKGGNIVFVTKNEYINDPNSYVKKVHMVGVVYKQDGASGKPIKPGDTTHYVASNSSDTTKTLIPGLTLSVTDCVGDPTAQTVTLYFTFNNATNVSRGINVYGGPRSNSVVANYIANSTIFDDNGGQYTCKDDFYALSKELPAGLKLKGMVTFSNILPSTKLIALAKLSVAFSDWDGGGNGKRGVIQFKNRKINWNGAAPGDTTEIVKSHWDTKIKNLNNGIDFSVTECKGDAKAQTVTIFFAFSNPRKSNQKVVVQNGFYGNSATAFDNVGNQYPFKNVTLADATNNNQIEKELPTGLALKGSITFSNILPTLDGLAMAKVPVVTSNWDGGDNLVSGMIEVQNIAIVWNNRSKGGAKIAQSGYLTYEQLLAKLNRGEKATNAKVIINNIYFETNAATLTESSKSHLGNVMLLLVKYPAIKATFTGHTDNVGREDDNLNLSTQRAKSVVDYLVSRGISRDRLFYQGLGSSKPIADNSTEEGRAKNRRTEMEIIAQ